MNEALVDISGEAQKSFEGSWFLLPLHKKYYNKKRISRSEAVILCHKKGRMLPLGWGERLTQTTEFKYLGILLTSDRKVKHGLVR